MLIVVGRSTQHAMGEAKKGLVVREEIRCCPWSFHPFFDPSRARAALPAKWVSRDHSGDCLPEAESQASKAGPVARDPQALSFHQIGSRGPFGIQEHEASRGSRR